LFPSYNNSNNIIPTVKRKGSAVKNSKTVQNNNISITSDKRKGDAVKIPTITSDKRKGDAVGIITPIKRYWDASVLDGIGDAASGEQRGTVVKRKEQSTVPTRKGKEAHGFHRMGRLVGAPPTKKHTLPHAGSHTDAHHKRTEEEEKECGEELLWCDDQKEELKECESWCDDQKDIGYDRG
jgi:hypothetical protein